MTPISFEPRKRRGRPRKVESFADWMARIDGEVEAAAKKIEKQPPAYGQLHPAQRRLVQMLTEHLRLLPPLTPGEDPFTKFEYRHINQIVTNLFLMAYPLWELAPRSKKTGDRIVGNLPREASELFIWMMTNCAGQAPPPGIRTEKAPDEDTE